MKKIIFSILFLSFIISGCGGNQVTQVINTQTENIGNFSDPLSLPESDDKLPPHEDNMIIVHYRDRIYDISEKTGGTVINTFSIGDKKYGKIKLPAGSSIVNTVRTIDKDVIYAEPVYTYTPDMVPDDFYYNYQYAPQICSAQEAWDITTGSEDITIAILDTGVNGTHCEFTGKMVTGFNAVTGEEFDGRINSDVMGHGTHVAGIAAATGNNGTGIAGVAWKCRIMPVVMAEGNEDIPNDVLLRAIVWATEHGARVINMSFSDKNGYSLSLTDAINYAMERNVVLVSSMGNTHRAMVRYPAACQGIIAVGAVDGRKQGASFSTGGNHISISAPGVDIFSTAKDGHYVSMSGTSMSAPFVTGVCALLASFHKGITPEEIRSQIELTAEDTGEPGWDRDTGWGNINVKDALGPLRENKYGRVKVYLKTVSGEPVVNNTVLLYSGENMTGFTKSDKDGLASFYYVNRGSNYRALSFDSKPGKTRYSGYFDVNYSSTVTVNGFE